MQRKVFWSQVLRHLLFWVAYYIYDGIITGLIEEKPAVRIVVSATALPVKLAATYVTLYLLNRSQATGRRLIYLFIYLLPSILLFGILQRTIDYEWVYPRYYPLGLNHPFWYAPKITIEIFGVYSVVAIVITFHFVKKWYYNEKEKQLLRQERLKMELKYLKAQIHPHFLFNTLNNLYSLTITGSKKSSEVVYKLSQLMSYMLYESSRSMVDLEKELEYIGNYISLEKIRYGERLDVSLNILTDISNIRVAPLLLLPFVENSFKHGFSNDTGRVWVHIDVLVNEGVLIIKVENSKGNGECRAVPAGEDPGVNGEGAAAGNRVAKEGIGLSNVRQQLELIYKESYNLTIHDEETFLVILKIALDEQGMERIAEKKSYR